MDLCLSPVLSHPGWLLGSERPISKCCLGIREMLRAVKDQTKPSNRRRNIHEFEYIAHRIDANHGRLPLSQMESRRYTREGE